jgi:hypothetical protein
MNAAEISARPGTEQLCALARLLARLAAYELAWHPTEENPPK